ncbi:MAG: hypothetical protein JOY78_00185 [Pseudonocardia sp.]|nr:hypothetical protein [Pseudonocardia sp.]
MDAGDRAPPAPAARPAQASAVGSISGATAREASAPAARSDALTDGEEARPPPASGPTESVAPPARRARARLWSVAAVALPTAVAAAHASLYGRWEVDDAGITFAYARSVATGAGPVLQPGAPPVEGFSDPTWLALLAFGRELGLFDHGTWFGVPDYVAYPKTLALVLLAVVFSAFLATASAVSRRPAAVTAVAGCACALIPSFVIWSVSGLENALLAAAVAVQVALLVRRRDALDDAVPAIACGLLAALAALTRPEGVVYAASYPLALLVVGRLRWRALGAAALSTVAFALPYGAYLLWRLTTFGQWLPTTAVAKSQGLPTVAGFAKVGALIGYAGWPVVLVAAVVVGAALAAGATAPVVPPPDRSNVTFLQPSRSNVTLLQPGGAPSTAGPAIALTLIPLGLALVAFGVLVPDWMEQYRFATPVWTLGPFVAVLAGAEVLAGVRWRARALVGAIAAAAAALSAVGFVTDVETFRANPTAPMCLIVTNTGREFNGYMDVLGLRSATFFAPEIGGAALTGRALLYDGGGLAEPTIARFWAAKNPAGIRDYVLDDVKPTFIRAHGSFRPFIGLDADPRFLRDYVEIGTFTNGGANWVRRDLVPDAATLGRLQAWGAAALAADAVQRATPRASCGDRLLVGPTTA